MKLFVNASIALVFSTSLYAQTFSINLENDVVDGKDNHYTNGSSFMYLSNKDTNNLDKYDSKFFEYISLIPTFSNNFKYQSIGISYSQLAFVMIGPSMKNKEFQKEYHRITGNSKPIRSKN